VSDRLPEIVVDPEPDPRRRRAGRVIAVVAGLLVLALVAGAALVLLVPREAAPEEQIATGPFPVPGTNPSFQPRAAFDMQAHSLDDPRSPWVVVNKQRPFQPKDWEPSDLVAVPVPYVNPAYMRSEAAEAIGRMFDDFEEQTGKRMQILSSYRSYAAQQQVYGGNDLLTARPGFSEHQTGWVADIDALPRVCSLQRCFEDTPQGEWLARHAWEYGFILRYPDGLTHITGYQYEPWHFRYVGEELAAEMHDQGVRTLEEFFDLPFAPDYD